MSKVKFTDNSAKVLGELNKTNERVLYALGVTAQTNITDYMSKPDFTGKDIVETGRLRASISFITPDTESGGGDGAISGKAEAKSVIIGTNVEYADDVNNGTPKQPARKFMEHGILDHKKELQNLANRIYEGKL